MSLAYETRSKQGRGYPAHVAWEDTPGVRLCVTVVFTSVDATLVALREAGRLADKLHGRIELVVPQVVPYPLPLTRPPVLPEFTRRRFRVIAAESSIETKVSVYLCRDSGTTLLAALRPESVVVIGGRRRWWLPTKEMRLASALRRAGHQVIFTEKE